MSHPVNYYPALVVGGDARLDGLYTDETTDGIRIREKSGLIVAILRDVEAEPIAWPNGLQGLLVRARRVEYGTAYLGLLGDAPVSVLIAQGTDCGCSGGPKRTAPTAEDRALLERASDWDLPV